MPTTQAEHTAPPRQTPAKFQWPVSSASACLVVCALLLTGIGCLEIYAIVATQEIQGYSVFITS